MRKKLLFTFILGILIVYFTYFINSQNPRIFFWFKQVMPIELKSFLKNTIFLIPELKKEIKIARENYNSILKKNTILSDELVSIQQAKNLVNQRIFPKTQFLTLSFDEIQIDTKSLSFREITYLNAIDKKRDGKKTKPFYVENINDKVIVTTFNGDILIYEIFDFVNKKFKNTFYIKNNLPNGITVLDSLLFKESFFISYIDRSKGCKHLKIVRAELNFIKLDFKNFYEQGEKNVNPEKCEAFSLGGRLEIINKLKDPSLIVSAANMDEIDLYETLKDQFNENLLQKIIHILSINLKSKEVSVISNGHRNPQGLFVNKKNIILSTEHGPRGGDEINKIISGKNYGWPIASYGENYNDNYEEEDEFVYLKNHSNSNFEEPIYSFVPSIGISQLIEVPKNFSKRWQNNYLITSLRKKSIFRVTFDKKFSRVISMEQINIGKRIRDISYNKNGKFFTLALEDGEPSIGILKPKIN